MKKTMTLALAASIFALTLSAFPHHAAASTTSTPPPSDSPLLRKAGGEPVKYMAVELAVEILSSVLVA